MSRGANEPSTLEHRVAPSWSAAFLLYGGPGSQQAGPATEPFPSMTATVEGDQISVT